MGHRAALIRQITATVQVRLISQQLVVTGVLKSKAKDRSDWNLVSVESLSSEAAVGGGGVGGGDLGAPAPAVGVIPRIPCNLDPLAIIA